MRFLLPAPVVRARVVAVVLLMVGAAGCSAGRPAPLVLGPDRPDITAPAGAVLEIEAGPENPGVGDDWRLGDVTPTGALSSVDKRWHDAPECRAGETGCGRGIASFRAVLAADLPTNTTVRFRVQNCWRGRCPADGGELVGEHPLVSYTITITP